MRFNAEVYHEMFHSEEAPAPAAAVSGEIVKPKKKVTTAEPDPEVKEEVVEAPEEEEAEEIKEDPVEVQEEEE